MEEKVPRCNGTIEEVTEDFLHDNEYIKTGYRLHFKGMWPVTKTMFKWHNETVNIWSHFLGVLLFFGLAVFILVHYPHMLSNGKKGFEKYLSVVGQDPNQTQVDSYF